LFSLNSGFGKKIKEYIYAFGVASGEINLGFARSLHNEIVYTELTKE